MGGSLVQHGGQNPIEAIKLGAAVMHGPFIANFAEIYAAPSLIASIGFCPPCWTSEPPMNTTGARR